ncbi:hypothetical protein FOL46_006871 [Perkinsus olseni]|uniref:Bromo domain-containing protein n=1 Tax=Perkinsus olseni TaxID=32597 RepID=A0A7J6LHB4_PEROL|nr:hypothetical protein FOL46_006871 [Perkinsus olseni]
MPVKKARLKMRTMGGRGTVEVSCAGVLASDAGQFKYARLRALFADDGKTSVVDGYGQTPLYYAVQRKPDQDARELTRGLIEEFGLEANHKDQMMQTPLFYAALVGNTATCELLVEKGAEVDPLDSNKQTPLFYAVREGHIHCTRALVTVHGAKADIVDHTGQPPLFYAARENRVEMCKMLIEELGVYAAQRDVKGKDAKFFVKDNDMLLSGRFDVIPFSGKRAMTTWHAVKDYAQIRFFVHRAYLASMADKALSSLADSGAPPRKKYRLVYKGDGATANSGGAMVTVEQMEEFERKYPDIAVWEKNAPISFGFPPSQTSPAKLNGQLQSGVMNSPQPRSSRGGAKKWQQLAKQLVRDIHNFDDTRIFLKPVDPVKDECSDYFTVVKHPMDFGTIRKKLHKGEYENALLFYEDCDLVFTNCALYNAPETFVMQQCRKIMGRFNELLVQLELIHHIEAARAERKEEQEKSKEEEEEEANVNSSISDMTAEPSAATVA